MAQTALSSDLRRKASINNLPILRSPLAGRRSRRGVLQGPLGPYHPCVPGTPQQNRVLSTKDAGSPLLRRSLRWTRSPGMAGHSRKESVTLSESRDFLLRNPCLPPSAFLHPCPPAPTPASPPWFRLSRFAPVLPPVPQQFPRTSSSSSLRMARLHLASSPCVLLPCPLSHSPPPLLPALQEAETPGEAGRREGGWVGPGAAVPPLGACVNVWR